MEPSPLLRLSPELRNQIYEYALKSQEEETRPSILAQQPALTRTCRRIRQESLLLFYNINTLHLTIPRDGAYTIAQHLLSSSHYGPPPRPGNSHAHVHPQIKSISLLKITYHLSSMENMPASLGVGVGCRVQGGWVDLAHVLAKLGFESSQVEWRAVSGTRFSHPALGGNYYEYLAESARVRALGEVMERHWEEAVKRKKEGSGGGTWR